MELKGRALFNLLRINAVEGQSAHVKQWQIEDLRKTSIEELFSRLKKLGVILDEESFYLYAENAKAPEELAECIWFQEEDWEGHDKAYLLLFELWKRLLPERGCLSVFCDKLDELIELYDRGELEDEEILQEALLVLQDILDDAYDEKARPAHLFKEVASYCAHDLEQFIIDYIVEQMEDGNETYASELIDAFRDYSSDPRKFDLLRAQLFALSNLDESAIVYGRILEELTERPDLDLALLVARSLIHHGDVRLFMRAVKLAMPLLKTEEELQNLLLMMAEYYRCLDRDEEESYLKKVLEARASHPIERALDPADPALSQMLQILSIHHF